MQMLKETENRSGTAELFSNIPKTTKDMNMLHKILKIVQIVDLVYSMT